MNANSQIVEGLYSNKWESPTGEAIAYNLALNEDGTFTFQSIRTFLDDVPNKTLETQGTWSLDGHLLVLTTNMDSNILSTELNKNKARFISVSPRNPNFNLVKPSLKFYESGVFYAKDMELFKTETSMTSTE